MKTSDPIITVLMPAYNAEEYIREAIDSVLEQTFQAFELLIINDGSTDGTESIIKKYSDDRIRVITQENKGVIGALNTGLAEAYGKYIARFDADDVCLPERLQIQYDFIESNNEYVLIGGMSHYIDKDGDFLFEWEPPAYEHHDIAEKILYTSPFDHPAVMYRKSIAVELKGYPSGAIHFEDHLFWTEFLDKGKVANLKVPLIKHRFNPSSVTIDEKWRGPVFKEIKYRSIKNHRISEEDAELLKKILSTQDVKKYKDAAYYSMMGKKYLWNNHQPKKAREHLKQAIAIMPQKPEPYVLYLLSYLPGKVIQSMYSILKKD